MFAYYPSVFEVGTATSPFAFLMSSYIVAVLLYDFIPFPLIGLRFRNLLMRLIQEPIEAMANPLTCRPFSCSMFIVM